MFVEGIKQLSLETQIVLILAWGLLATIIGGIVGAISVAICVKVLIPPPSTESLTFLKETAANIKTQVAKLDDYCHLMAHESKNDTNAVNLKVTELLTMKKMEPGQSGTGLTKEQ